MSTETPPRPQTRPTATADPWMAADEPLTTAARLAAGVARAPLTFDSGCRRRLTNCIDAANQAQLRSR